MILKVPVRPHVFKYLSARYPLPFLVNEKSHVAEHLYLLMRRPLNHNFHSNHLTRYTEVLEISVNLRQIFARGATNLTPSTVVRFNEYIDAQIKEELIHYLNFIEEFSTGTWKKGIYNFMDKYNLQEGIDVTYDGFQKYYYRYRKQAQRLKA